MDASRRQRVGEILLSKPYTSLTELIEMFPDVSSMTLRRDIEYYEQKGDVIKVRGGARALKYLTQTLEEAVSVRSAVNINEKDRIAKAAVSYIESGRSLFFDSGSTIMRMVSYLPNEKLNITTSDPSIALALAKNEKYTINMIGGNLNHSNLSLSGLQALDFVGNTNIDIAFLSPSGFSLACGFSNGNYNESLLKNAVVNKARFVVMLVSSNKLEKTMPYTFAGLQDIDVFITDAEPGDEFRRSCSDSGVSLIVQNINS